jgi:hypothetical protein
MEEFDAGNMPDELETVMKKLAVMEAESIKKDLKEPLTVFYGVEKAGVLEIKGRTVRTMWDVIDITRRLSMGEISDGVGGATIALQLVVELISKRFME